MRTILDNTPIGTLIDAATEVLGSNHSVTRSLATAQRTRSVGAEMQARDNLMKLPKHQIDAVIRLTVRKAG
jgi:hypothetical protein